MRKGKENILSGLFTSAYTAGGIRHCQEIFRSFADFRLVSWRISWATYCPIFIINKWFFKPFLLQLLKPKADTALLCSLVNLTSSQTSPLLIFFRSLYLITIDRTFSYSGRPFFLDSDIVLGKIFEVIT